MGANSHATETLKTGHRARGARKCAHKEVIASSSLYSVFKDIFQRNSVYSSDHLIVSNVKLGFVAYSSTDFFGPTLQASCNITTVSPI